MENKEEIKEVFLTLVNADADIDLALNKIINIPDKYIEPFMRDYAKIYLSQIYCLIKNIYKKIYSENSEVIEDIYAEAFENLGKN